MLEAHEVAEILRRTRMDAGITYPDKRMPPVRCPRHGLVYPPCLACQVEAVRNRSKGGYP